MSSTKHLVVQKGYAGRPEIDQIDTGYNEISGMLTLAEAALLTAHSSLDDKDAIVPVPVIGEATNNKTNNTVSKDTEDDKKSKDDKEKKDDDEACTAGNLTQFDIQYCT